MHIAVVIPYRSQIPGDHRTLAWALEGYANQGLGLDDSMEIRLGVDGEDPTLGLDLFDHSDPRHLSIHPYSRRGAAGVRNALVRETSDHTDLLIFANADARPDPDMVAQHARVMATLPPRSLVLGAAPWERNEPTVIDALIDQTPMIFSYCHMSPHTWYPFRIAYSLNLSVRREDFIDCGGFHEEIRPVFYEDLAFGCRLLGPQHKGVFFEPAARVLHRHPMTFDQYLDREESLGLMAPVLARGCPGAFAVLMANRNVAEIAADFRSKIKGDMATYRQLYFRLRDKLARPAAALGESIAREREIATLFQLHIPVKLMAFRLGFLKGLELADDQHWLERKPQGLWRECFVSSL